MTHYLIILVPLLFCLCLSAGSMPINTYVTSFIDIKRGQSQSPRSVEYYYHYFQLLLAIDINLIIFGDSALQKFVWQRRQKHNTFFIQTTMDDIRAKWFYKKTEEIRNQRLTWPRFQTRSDILFSLKDYNAIMTAKIDCLYDAWKLDPFNSDYIYWIDAGFFHIETNQTMTPQNVMYKLLTVVQPLWINHAYGCCHNRYVGYTNDASEQYLERTLDMDEQSVIAHIYGGYKELISDCRNALVNLVNMHLHNSDMNSDENYWTLMLIRFPYLLPNSFQADFNMRNHSVNIRQAAFKNQKPHRSFVLKLGQENRGFFSVGKDTISKFQSYSDYQNVLSNLDSIIATQQERRINLIRQKIDSDKNILKRRVAQLILLIIFGIIGLMVVRKVEYSLIKAIISNKLFQSVPSTVN